MEHLSFPNESTAYRAARAALLDDEIALRRQIEAVAAKRRALPPGGTVPEDYAFERIGAFQRPEPVTLSDLFGEPSGPSGLWQGLVVGLTCAAAMLTVRLARSARKRIRRAA